MSKANLSFGDIEVKKSTFNKTKHPIDIDKVDIKTILTSDKISYAKKCFRNFIDIKIIKKSNYYVYCFQK